MEFPRNCADCPFSEDRQLGRNRLYCGHRDKMVMSHHTHSIECISAFNSPQKNNMAVKFQNNKKRNQRKQTTGFIQKIEPCSNGAWYVQSESTPNAYYRTNRETGHCTCPSNKNDCKHHKAVAKKFRISGTNIEVEAISPSFLYLVYQAGDSRSVGQLGKHGGEFIFTMDSRIVCRSSDLCKVVSEIEVAISEVFANV